MSKHRWMKAAIRTAEAGVPLLPWSRGRRRSERKAAARARALAA